MYGAPPPFTMPDYLDLGFSSASDADLGDVFIFAPRGNRIGMSYS